MHNTYRYDYCDDSKGSESKCHICKRIRRETCICGGSHSKVSSHKPCSRCTIYDTSSEKEEDITSGSHGIKNVWVCCNCNTNNEYSDNFCSNCNRSYCEDCGFATIECITED